MSDHRLARPVPIVGRDGELAALRRAWDQARSGTPWTVLVEGAAGMGKTALVQHWLTTVGSARLLQASGDELEGRLAYGVIEQLARGLGTDTPLPGSDPLETGAAFVGLLDDLQVEGPVIVLVDDAHWADVVSLQALTFAARRLRADRVLTVVVARPDAVHLPEGLRRLASGKHGTAVTLGGLDAREIVDLAAAMGAGTLPRQGALRLRAHTGGNPLHTVALLSELPAAAISRPDGDLPAPRSFKTLVLARLEGCSEPAQRLVRATAVLGQRCPLGLAARLAGLDDAPSVLDEALAAGLLRADGRTVAFPHPLVRAAVYHDLTPARRSGLHARAAAMVDEPSALDHRVAAALTEDPKLAEELVARARAEAEDGAPAAAAGRLLAAARLVVDSGLRERFLLDAAALLIATGDAAGAAALRDELEELPDSARRRVVFGQLAMLTGRDEDAERLLSGAWELADPERDADVAALAGATLSQVLLNQARGEETVAWARRVRAVAGAHRPEGSVALSTLAGGLAITGRAEEALAMVAEYPAGDAELTPDDVEGVLARGVVALWTDRLEAARVDLAALAESGSWRPMRVRLISLGHLAEAEFRLGLWDASLAHGALAQSLADDTDSAWLATHVRVGSAQVLAARGEWDAAEAVCREAWTAAQALGSAASIGYGASVLAFLAAVHGEHAAVVEAVQPILALERRDGIDEPGFMPWRELHADALVALGRLEEAESALAPFEAVAAKRQRHSAMAHANRVRGRLEAVRGEAAAAQAAFEAAGRHAGEVASPLLRAQVDESHGRFLRRQGERSAAAQRLRAAREVYAALGAEPLRERCDRELAACGLSPSRRDPHERRALTPQELAVARLVASGMANREVASELVISVKTVEYHLGNVYVKLGIHSRTQLAASFADR